MSSHTTLRGLEYTTSSHTFVPVPLIEWLSGYEGETIGYFADGSYHWAEADDVVETDRFVFYPNHSEACGISDYHASLRLQQIRKEMGL